MWMYNDVWGCAEILPKGGLVHCVPCANSREKLREIFQSVCVLLCK